MKKRAMHLKKIGRGEVSGYIEEFRGRKGKRGILYIIIKIIIKIKNSKKKNQI